jgi:hypothetical protein
MNIPMTPLTDHMSPDAEHVVQLLVGYATSGKLWRLYETVREGPPASETGTNCHNNVLALAADLWEGRVHDRWWIMLGRNEKTWHSWLEYGDAAVDLTYDRFIVSTAQDHREQARVEDRRYFSGRSALKDYKRACVSVGILARSPT